MPVPPWSALLAAVVDFRAGAVKLAQSRKVGDPRGNVSIFSEPLDLVKSKSISMT